MKIALVQFDIEFEKPLSNLKKLDTLFQSIAEPIDLIIIPEMFTTGFSMNVEELAEPIVGMSVSWMLKTSKLLNTTLVGSLIIRDKDAYFNRLVVTNPQGILAQYDKRHLFGIGEEDKYYSSGNQKVFFEIDGFKFCPLICYDLRFPIWSRNTNDYDVLIYVANWPASRSEAWTHYLKQEP